MEDIVAETYFADDAGEVMIVKLKGYIDQSNSFGLQGVFNDIVNSGCYNLIIDFSQVLYISSAGWGIFVGEIKRFRDNDGDIKLTNMSPDIYEVYQMLEFYHIFKDFASIESALEAFQDNSTIINEKAESPNMSKTDNLVIIENEADSNKEESSESDMEISINESEEDAVIDENDDSIEISIKGEMSDLSKSVEESEEQIIEDESPKVTEEIRDPMIDLSKLPLLEKIKKLIAEYPLLSIMHIMKLLKDERFGPVKINIFKLYKLLKENDLETKEKRYRYFRSC